MTEANHTPAQVELLPVSKEAREAASGLWLRKGGDTWFASQMRTGEVDNCATVQAFAEFEHRLNASSDRDRVLEAIGDGHAEYTVANEQNPFNDFAEPGRAGFDAGWDACRNAIRSLKSTATPLHTEGEAGEADELARLREELRFASAYEIGTETRARDKALMWRAAKALRLTPEPSTDVLGGCPVCFGEGKDRFGEDDCRYCSGTGSIPVGEHRIVNSEAFLREVSNPAIRLGLARAALASLAPDGAGPAPLRAEPAELSQAKPLVPNAVWRVTPAAQQAWVDWDPGWLPEPMLSPRQSQFVRQAFLAGWEAGTQRADAPLPSGPSNPPHSGTKQ